MERFVRSESAGKKDAVALEQCIMEKGKPATSGSKMLNNFTAPFDAEVVSRLNATDTSIAGRVEMREFAVGGSFFDTQFGSPAIEALLAGDAGFALCSDVFGEIRSKAPMAGLAYIHPTYGSVSRYGLIPLAASMDQIGVLCKGLEAGFQLLSKIAGSDLKDGAMLSEKEYEYTKINRRLRIGIPTKIVALASEADQTAIKSFCANFETENIDLTHFEIAKQVMTILAFAEASNNISRYDGIKFGYRANEYKNLEELYVRSRSEGFGLPAKLAAIMGTYVLSRDQYESYYEKAMKVRRLIKNSFEFDKYDLIVLPLSISDDAYENLSLYALSPLAGLPSVSFQYEGQGIQLIANSKDENALITAWEVAQA
ncbi:MAG: amidase family protein [Oscillospiraceae bacterium]|nr:amidase family protein [Oscillospiraceae bacterium]